jgi:beta-glucosidase
MTAMPPKGSSQDAIRDEVEAILRAATLEEKVAMMSGRGFFASRMKHGRYGGEPYAAGGGCARLGVPPLYFTDGPRGVALGSSTCFPVTMARGASFDPDLERRIGEAMAIEARAQGCTLSGAVCVNLLRHPAWGRAQETYGEDPFHLGEMGAALAEGLQTHNVIATVKHFAVNSIENARFRVDVRVDERTLHEVYLPHFRRILDSGCASVMSAYNRLNGEYCGQNARLLNDILRGDWHFDGFVHSDWIRGVYQPYGAACGLDVENPEPMIFPRLVEAVKGGFIAPAVIDTACRRILLTQLRFACAEDPLPHYDASLVACDAHRALAQEAAEKSAVLLTNDGVLPLPADKLRRIAVLGRLAAVENAGDNGSSSVRAPYIITPLQGLRAFLADDVEILTATEADLKAVTDAAASAEVCIVVAGTTAEEEGEYIPGELPLDGLDVPPEIIAMFKARRDALGGDRLNLDLPAAQVAMIEAAAATGTRVIVVLVGGSAFMVEPWLERAAAVLQTFYSGMEGGTALARLVFGAVSPSGKLPFSVARDAAHYPFFDREANEIEYGPYHGYTKLDRDGNAPRFAFGHGLSYARFSYRALQAERRGDTLAVSVALHNHGPVDAEEVVQAYVSPPGITVERPAKLLRGFRRIAVPAGATMVARLTIPVATLQWYDPACRAWKLESGVHTVRVGGSSNETISAEVVL